MSPVVTVCVEDLLNAVYNWKSFN